MKKAIVSRRSISLNSSSVRNSLAYVLRSKRIAALKTNTRLSELDTIERMGKCWDAYGNRKVYIRKEYDRLQYIMAFSNLDKNPENLYSIAKGKAVTAENLHEESDEYSVLARLYRQRARTCRYDAVKYDCKKYFEYAEEFEKDAEYYEAEAERCCDRALEMERAAEFFQYEAEELEKEEAYVSGWENWLDM